VTDLSKITRLPNGTLLCDQMTVGCCDNCDAAHVYFKFQGHTFAVAMIEPGDALSVGTRLIEIHDFIAKRQGRPARNVSCLSGLNMRHLRVDYS
jgi:hypothetical protein